MRLTLASKEIWAANTSQRSPGASLWWRAKSVVMMSCVSLTPSHASNISFDMPFIKYALPVVPFKAINALGSSYRHITFSFCM